MSWGIMEMLGSISVLMVVIPPAIAGVELLVRGNHVIGAALLGVALGIVIADQYIMTPGDLPKLVVSKLVGAVVTQPDDGE